MCTARASYSKGTHDDGTFNHCRDNEGTFFKTKSFSIDEIKEYYEKYLSESTQGSISSKGTISQVKPWIPQKSSFEK